MSEGDKVWLVTGIGVIWKKVDMAWVCNRRLSWWAEVKGGLKEIFTNSWMGWPKWVKVIESEVGSVVIGPSCCNNCTLRMMSAPLKGNANRSVVNWCPWMKNGT